MASVDACEIRPAEAKNNRGQKARQRVKPMPGGPQVHEQSGKEYVQDDKDRNGFADRHEKPQPVGGVKEHHVGISHEGQSGEHVGVPQGQVSLVNLVEPEVQHETTVIEHVHAGGHELAASKQRGGEQDDRQYRQDDRRQHDATRPAGKRRRRLGFHDGHPSRPLGDGKDRPNGLDQNIKSKGMRVRLQGRIQRMVHIFRKLLSSL